MNLFARIIRAIPPELWALLLIAVPLIVVALGRIELIHHHTPHLLDGPRDPDSWLRLSQAKDWLSGGDWFDHRVTRSDAPHGATVTPWTRPLDVVLAGIVTLQPGDAPLQTKLLLAASALPVLWMVLMMLGLLSAARQLHATPLTYLILAALVGGTPVLWSYFGGGNADHHAPLAALWAWVLALALRAKPRVRDGWAQGILLALMLWISPEALMLIALIYAWPLLRWWHGGGAIWPLVTLTSAAAYGSLIALAIERPTDQWLTPIYDSISIVHVLLMALCAIAVRAFALLPLPTRRGRTIAILLAGAAALGTLAALYPDALRGPMAAVDPFIHAKFLPRINEAKPLLAKSPFFAAALLVLPVLALAATIKLYRTTNPLLPGERALQLLFLLVGTLAMALTQLRWYSYLFPLAALILSPLIGSLVDEDERWPARLVTGARAWERPLLRAFTILIITGLPLALFALAPTPSTSTSLRISQCEKVARTAIRSGALQRALGDEPLTLYAPTNLGTEILFFTPYRIVASNYHREGAGIRYVWGAMRLNDSDALRAHLAKRGVDAMLVCPDATAEPGAVLMQWLNGAVLPNWAQRIPLFSSKTLLVRIKP